jgi:serine/threonine protein phosphatase PrpC
MQYSLAQRSLIGKRAINQDRVACLEREDAVLLALADGLGGYPGSEHAAQALVESVSQSFARNARIDDPETFLVLAVAQAHSRVNQRTRDMGFREDQAPRTTCVLCLVQRGCAYFAHVGDSRLYHLRDGEELDRTLDHSTAASPETRELLGDEDPFDGSSGRLWQCVGGPRRPQVSVGEAAVLARDDLLLLCSDGLWHALSGGELIQTLDSREAALDEALDQLFERAMSSPNYSGDNVSAILFRYEDDMIVAEPPRRRRATRASDAARPAAADVRGLGRKVVPRPATRDDMQRAIDEIESFVKKFDKDL